MATDSIFSVALDPVKFVKLLLPLPPSAKEHASITTPKLRRSPKNPVSPVGLKDERHPCFSSVCN